MGDNYGRIFPNYLNCEGQKSAKFLDIDLSPVKTKLKGPSDQIGST